LIALFKHWKFTGISLPNSPSASQFVIPSIGSISIEEGKIVALSWSGDYFYLMIK